MYGPDVWECAQKMLKTAKTATGEKALRSACPVGQYL